jgi:hypothetical protein
MFIPHLAWPRDLAEFAAQDAVLLMEKCWFHVTDDVIRIPTGARLRVITFAPHATQVFQVLHLTLFGILKRRSRYELTCDGDNATVKFIMTVYHDFTQIMMPPNVCRAFNALGFECDTRREPYELLFDEEKLRESAGFEELCSVTFPWTSCRADDVLLGSVGSTRLSKST